MRTYLIKARIFGNTEELFIDAQVEVTCREHGTFIVIVESCRVFAVIPFTATDLMTDIELGMENSQIADMENIRWDCKPELVQPEPVKAANLADFTKDELELYGKAVLLAMKTDCWSEEETDSIQTFLTQIMTAANLRKVEENVINN